MVINRVIDNAAVSAASVLRRPVTVARAQAQAHPAAAKGAKVFGIRGDYSPEWAAWANGVAVRELISTTRFWPPSIRIPATTFPPWWPSPSTWVSGAPI